MPRERDGNDLAGISWSILARGLGNAKKYCAIIGPLLLYEPLIGWFSHSHSSQQGARGDWGKESLMAGVRCSNRFANDISTTRSWSPPQTWVRAHKMAWNLILMYVNTPTQRGMEQPILLNKRLLQFFATSGLFVCCQAGESQVKLSSQNKY